MADLIWSSGPYIFTPGFYSAGGVQTTSKSPDGVRETFRRFPLTLPRPTAVSWITSSNIGLRLRAAGEDPATANIAGVNIQLYRLMAVVLSGALCGLAGAYLALASSFVWVEHMVAGRGWVVIALVIFSGWRPGRAVIGALIFGGAEAVIPRIQTMGLDVPIYIVGMLPYVLTLAVLIVSTILRGEKSPAPASLLLNYLRQDRR